MRKPRPFFLENELDVYEKEQGRVTLEEEDEVEDEDDEESDENEDDGKLPMYLRDEFGVASKRVFESANDIVQSLNLEPGIYDYYALIVL